jgi:3'(2'), 5'-bisphosphate nucleotidase
MSYTQVDPDDREALIAALRPIATRAGEAILTFYTDDMEVRRKDDNSPVTDADQAAEDLILAALRQITPGIPIVAEEAMSAGDQPDVSGGRFWLVDPLDGTKEFITRNGEFTVNIALIENGRPVAGIVYAPALGQTWTGATVSATHAEAGAPPKPIEARAIPAEGATVIASRRHGSGPELDAFLARYTVKDQITAGSSLKFCLVAAAKADLYPRFGRTMEWDTAAGHAVLLAAGGQVVRAYDGTPLAYGKPGFENPHFIARGK